MSDDQNRNTALAITEEIFNQGDLSKIDKYFTPDLIEHQTPPPGVPEGREHLRFTANMIRTAFPNFHYVVEDIIEQGDKLVIRTTASGTNTGTMMGTPPTGKSATWSEVHIARFVNGVVVEHWPSVDQLGMLQQLGIVPMPGQ